MLIAAGSGREATPARPLCMVDLQSMSSLDWCVCSHVRFWHSLNKGSKDKPPAIECESCKAKDLKDSIHEFKLATER